MQLRQLLDLDAIGDRLAAKQGRCRYCDVLHAAGQCQHPKNWGKQSRGATAVFEANQAGEEARHQRQLERRLERERVLSIKL